MSEPFPNPAQVEPLVAAAPTVLAAPAAAFALPKWMLAVIAVLGALTLISLALAWKADQRGANLEQELVRRQQDTARQATEAGVLSKQAEEGVRNAGAKVALLEARVAEVALQRTQLEDLIQSLSRSRDENLLIDVEAAIRVALQQTAITGSAEPLVAALKQSGERLERHQEPRLEGVRRAVVRDLDRIKAVSVTDIASLAIKLDEAIRMVDDLTLLANAEPRSDTVAKPGAKIGATADVKTGATSSTAAGKSASSSDGFGTLAALPGKAGEWWNLATGRVWTEVKSLVRVTRIDHPDAMLLAPEQSFFVRENLKLRLLNARLALLSRQFDTAQSDMMGAQAALDRYFDRSSKRTTIVTDLIRQVAGQARQEGIPRPDDTLAALTAAGAGR